MLLGRICYANEGIFQKGCGLLTDLGLSDLPIGRTGEEAASIAALPAENRWCFGPQGGAFTGVNWWVMVTLLEGVWVCPAAACADPAHCVFPEV